MSKIKIDNAEICYFAGRSTRMRRDAIVEFLGSKPNGSDFAAVVNHFKIKDHQEKIRLRNMMLALVNDYRIHMVGFDYFAGPKADRAAVKVINSAGNSKRRQ